MSFKKIVAVLQPAADYSSTNSLLSFSAYGGCRHLRLDPLEFIEFTVPVPLPGNYKFFFKAGRGPNEGIVAIYVNDTLYANIDNYRNPNNQLIANWIPVTVQDGETQFKVRFYNTGDKNPSAGNNQVVIANTPILVYSE